MQLGRSIIAYASLATLLIAGTGSVGGKEGIKEDARKAGRAVGSATREVWEGAKKTGKEIGHDARKAGRTISDAAKEGAHEVKRSFKGEK